MTSIALTALDSSDVFGFVSSKLEATTEHGLSRLDVRCSNLSVAVDAAVGDDSEETPVPTLLSDLKKELAGITAKKRVVTKHILKSVSGVFEPGTMTLVLGQPGSGKSTLLKVLAGRFPTSKTTRIDGDRASILRTLPQHVAYVTQHDMHFPALTVRETLEFAHECCGGDLLDRMEKQCVYGTAAENEAAVKAARALFKDYPDVVIQQLGLDQCQHTIVGDAMMRGVSGGERKRVTLGEMLFGDKRVLLMDEISTGLDSATAFDIVSTQRVIARAMKKTVVMSLLQPSPEVFELFDNVLILNDGEVVYHGPCHDVAQHFTSIGYVCPPERNVADFLVDLGTDQQQQYRLPVGRVGYIPTIACEFADAFVRSEVSRSMLEKLRQPEDERFLLVNQPVLASHPEFHQSFWKSTKTLLRRQAKTTFRNRAYILGRVITVVIVGFLYGTLFYQFEPTEVQVVLGVTFMVNLFLAVGQSTENPAFMAAREVFYKQRGANFYRTSSYLVAYAACQIPLALFETALCGSIIYWACGFVSSGSNFLLFELFLFLTNLSFSSWFFFVAAVSPNIQIAEPLGMLSVLIYVLFTGFVVTKDRIPDYLMWLYWMNPLGWIYRSLSVLQYRHESMDICIYDGIDYCGAYGKTMGEYFLGTFDIPSEKYWIPLGLGYLLLSYVAFMAMTHWALENCRYETPEGASVGIQQAESPCFDQETTSGDSIGLIQTPKEIDNTGSAFVILEHAQAVQPITVAFMDLWYSVPDPKKPKESIDLLKGVSGYAMPSTVTALMGSSGAGKTTLMDVIAGRKTGGKVQGQILLNGYPATDLAIRRCTGYCEQMDVHSDTATFREALTFSAFLRQGSDVPDSYKLDSVNECLQLLDLGPIADKIIRGSSMEQLKRLTIGVELAAQPSVLFLDEPTSGLDARAAKHIMDGVRKVADTGRTIICTIHQPSYEVFQVFDQLLLLKRGGETVFFGDLKDDAREMIAHFESIEGVPKMSDGYNPAAWMLDVIGAGVGGGDGTVSGDIGAVPAVSSDFVAEFDRSVFKERLVADLNREGVAMPSPGALALVFSSKRAASEWTQMRLLMARFFRMYWRNADYNLTRFVVAVVMALIFAALFAGAEYESFQGVNSGLGMLYMSIIFVGVVSYKGAVLVAFRDRAAFYRERASQTYNAFWYFFAMMVVELPYVFLSALLFTSVFFPSVGFSGVYEFLVFWLFYGLAMLMQVHLGQLLAILMPSFEAAAGVGMLCISIIMVHMGFNPPASALPTLYKWIYYVVPQKYVLSIVAAIIFCDCPGGDGTSNNLGCRVLENAPPTLPVNVTVKQYVESMFLMKHEEIWLGTAVVLGYGMLVPLFILLSLRFVHHGNK